MRRRQIWAAKEAEKHTHKVIIEYTDDGKVEEYASYPNHEPTKPDKPPKRGKKIKTKV